MVTVPLAETSIPPLMLVVHTRQQVGSAFPTRVAGSLGPGFQWAPQVCMFGPLQCELARLHRPRLHRHAPFQIGSCRLSVAPQAPSVDTSRGNGLSGFAAVRAVGSLADFLRGAQVGRAVV